MSDRKALSSCRLIEAVLAYEYVEVNSSCALCIVLPTKVLVYLMG